MFRMQVEFAAEVLGLSGWECCSRSRALEREAMREFMNEAPVSDYAAMRVLASRKLLDDLENEWPVYDDGWLDRVVCGTLKQPAQSSLSSMMRGGAKEKAYLGFLLVSFPAPDLSEHATKHYTSHESQFSWPDWCWKRRGLKVDHLHLLALEGGSVEPEESFELAKLTCGPGLRTGADGKLSVMLDFGSQVSELRVEGLPQAERWVTAIKMGLLSATSAVQFSAPVMAQALQKFDAQAPTARAKQASEEAHGLVKDTYWRNFGEACAVLETWESLPVAIAQLASMSTPKVSTQLLLDICRNIASLPVVLLNAAVRQERPRDDVLDFWSHHYHMPVCRAIEVVWELRGAQMVPTEIGQVVVAIDAYRALFSSLHISDPSFGPSLMELSEHYSRTACGPMLDLAQDVAGAMDVDAESVAEGRGCRTSAAPDLLAFFGPTIELAIMGPPELRGPAADAVSDALKEFQHSVRRRFVDATSLPVAECTRLVAACLMDADDFAGQLHELVQQSPDALIPEALLRAGNRFRDAAEAYCESLVTILLNQSGIARHFGSSFGSTPSIDKVWKLDLASVLQTSVSGEMAKHQDMVGGPWRNRLALRSARRVVALLLHLLFRKQGDLVMAWGYSSQKLADKLQEHYSALLNAASCWESGASGSALVQRQSEVLLDVSSFLSESPDLEKLSLVLAGLKKKYGSSFSPDVAQRLVTLRTEMASDLRKALVAKAADIAWEASAAKRTSMAHTHVVEAELIGKQATSAFDWAMDDRWVAVVFSSPERGIGKYLAAQFRGRQRENKAPSVPEVSMDFLEAFLDVDSSRGSSGTAAAPQKPLVPELQSRGPKESGSPAVRGPEEDTSDDDDEEDEDEEQDSAVVMRGYLWRKGKASLASAARGGGLATSWKKSYFVLSKDFSGSHRLCWFKKQSDRVAKGHVPMADVLEVTSVDVEGDRCSHAMVLRLASSAATGSEELELRTPYEGERQLWSEKIKLIVGRESGGSSQFISLHPSKVVRQLDGHLHIKSPSRSSESQA